MECANPLRVRYGSFYANAICILETGPRRGSSEGLEDSLSFSSFLDVKLGFLLYSICIFPSFWLIATQFHAINVFQPFYSLFASMNARL